MKPSIWTSVQCDMDMTPQDWLMELWDVEKYSFGKVARRLTEIFKKTFTRDMVAGKVYRIKEAKRKAKK